ncbi:MAG TPA: hypothetical protein PK493_16975, partial [Pseudomonadota bacterium]|nr:hypothetical protein [Pseudomonadota bacterium]
MSSSQPPRALWAHPLKLVDDLSLPAARLRLGYLLLMLGMLPVLLLLGTARFPSLARLAAWVGLLLSGLPALHIVTSKRARPSAVAGLSLMIALCYFLATLHEERLLLRWGEARITGGAVTLAMA